MKKKKKKKSWIRKVLFVLFIIFPIITSIITIILAIVKGDKPKTERVFTEEELKNNFYDGFYYDDIEFVELLKNGYDP